jgi:NAD-dependent deacetylase
LIASSRSIVAFTGAGISTESGIADFRSPGGIWSRHQPVPFDEFVSSRAARVRFWQARLEMYEEFRHAQPNDGHLALARLENEGRLRGVITQNIDGLHQIAGSRSVIEIHGTARVIACIGCGKEWEPDAVHAMIRAGDEAPDCDDCGQPLKSKTISFGQMMPQAELMEAAQWAGESDLFISVGSSLVVEPAASLPRIAAQNGAALVIINCEPTPQDFMARLVIRAPIGETLRAAVPSPIGSQIGRGGRGQE